MVQSIERKSIPNEVKHLIAGGISGMLAKTIVAPIDRIKILYQVTATPFRLRDVPKVAMKICEEEGISALWRGNTATMVRVFPYAGIQFMIFNKIKEIFVDNSENEALKRSNANVNDVILKRIATKQRLDDKKWGMKPLESLFAGSMAGATSVLMTYPLDLTRAQLAVSKGNGSGFVKVLCSNYSNGGVTGLFQGITPTLLGMLPYAGVAFTINEQSKRQIYKMKHRDPTVAEKMVCGGLAGLVAQSMTYPFEVTRRRMQTIGILSSTKDTAVNVLGGNLEIKPALDAATIAEKHVVDASTTAAVESPSASTKSSALQKSPSMLRIMKQVMQEQGINGFFKGLSMNWLKGPVSFAISFTAFDLVKEWIDEKEAEWIDSRRV